MRSFIMVLVICSFFLPTAISLSAGTGSPEEPSVVLTKPTENKLFTVEIRLSRKNLVVGQNSATLFLCDDKQNSINGAEVRVLPVITAHGESTSPRPFVQEKSDGNYSVENLYIDMEGNWTLKIMIRKDGISDNVSFDFPGVKRRAP
ncbi:MAG: FixH family protein [Thermodesulfovibrionales bacterium]|nr:FixH family protein [Thermodesulfovibrionales bacterium]